MEASHKVDSSFFDSVRSVLLGAVLRTSPALNLRLRRLCGPLDGAIALLCRTISLTVTDLFMTIVVPICAVNVDVAFARRLMILFSVNLYCCNLAKNVMRLPRPHRADDASRPLSEEEKSFGFPSLHCAASVAMPLFILSAASPLTVDDDLRVRVLVAWAASISFARLYLGVHSLPDVLGGWALGWALWRQFDQLVASGRLDAALGHAVDARGLSDDTVTESVIVLGCASGALLAGWRAAALPALAAPPLAHFAALDGAGGALARTAAALGGTLGAKTLLKALARLAVDAAADLLGWSAPTPAAAYAAFGGGKKQRQLARTTDGTSARERCARLLCYVALAWFLLDALPSLVVPR